MTIAEKYKQHCNTPSDINELLPYLKEYANKCTSVIELGVRHCVSTYAFLNSNAKIVYGYDIEKQPQVEECKALALKEGKDWRFIEADVLKIELPECDFLFIDTFHSKLQLEQELALHADKAKKYIGFHDVTTFWEEAEPYFYPHAQANGVMGNEGLKYAIEPFLKNHPEWEIALKVEHNNGLLILQKVEIEYCIDCCK
jgi:hypothetical protein